MTVLRVLIVDDDPDDVLLTRGLLQEASPSAYEVTVAKSATSGLIELTRGNVDVALIDHRLGAETGIDLIRKAVALNSPAPLLLLTGVGDDALDDAALRAGASGYLPKAGLTPQRLTRAIRYAVTRRRNELERIELMREQVARQRAEAAKESRDRFLAVASHELRNPLNAIVGWSQILLEAGLDSPISPKAVRAIHRNALLQTKLVNALIDEAHIADDSLTLQVEPVDLADVVDAVLETVQLAAERSGVELVRPAAHTFPTIEADATRLQQVISNLVENALKFTPSGGKITLEVELGEGDVTLRVSDNGRGIEPDRLTRVFERAERDRSRGGLGLGLWIVKAIVLAHGGSVTAHSDGPGHGATFTVRFPAHPADPSIAPRRRRTSPHSIEQAALASRRVLVVDPDSDSLDYILSTITLHGANAQGVSTTKAAWFALENNPYDSIICSLEAGADAVFELMRRIRASDDSSIRGIQAASIGLAPDADERARSLAAGVQIHLSKPIAPRELVSLLTELGRPL